MLALFLAFSVSESTLLWVVGVLVSVLTPATLFAASLAAQSGRQSRAEIQKLAIEVAELRVMVGPFWQGMQTKIAAALHNPHEKDAPLDRLLEKLEAVKLTAAEKLVLIAMLENLRTEAEPDIAAKAAALLAVMPLVLKEAAGELPETDQRTILQKQQAEAKQSE